MDAADPGEASTECPEMGSAPGSGPLFEEAGEIMLFIDEDQVTFLEDLMSVDGCLDTSQMSGAFHLLRSNDLIWSRVLRDYLLGKRQPR